jgi:dephospho-CoA kinase
MRVIGLTGGIATGKSLVAKRLVELGAELIDADRVGWETYKQGTETYRAVIDAFGQDIVGADGEIDRSKLGPKVFGDADQRQRLEAIVWPAIRRLTSEKLDDLRARRVDVAVVEAAVLIEAAWQDLCDEVWLVVTTPDTAIARMIARNGLSREAAESRLAAQLSNDDRRAHADVVIENDGSLEELMRRVEEEWSKLRERVEVSA